MIFIHIKSDTNTELTVYIHYNRSLITLLLDIASCAKEDSQFIIVTHSPILLGIPDAEILSFDSGEIHPIEYEDTDSYKITEMFINSREQILKRLLG